MIKIGIKKYLDIKEYAAEKRVTIQTVYNWIKNKEVKTKKMYNAIFVEL